MNPARALSDFLSSPSAETEAGIGAGRTLMERCANIVSSSFRHARTASTTDDHVASASVDRVKSPHPTGSASTAQPDQRKRKHASMMKAEPDMPSAAQSSTAPNTGATGSAVLNEDFQDEIDPLELKRRRRRPLIEVSMLADAYVHASRSDLLGKMLRSLFAVARRTMHQSIWHAAPAPVAAPVLAHHHPHHHHLHLLLHLLSAVLSALRPGRQQGCIVSHHCAAGTCSVGLVSTIGSRSSKRVQPVCDQLRDLMSGTGVLLPC